MFRAWYGSAYDGIIIVGCCVRREVKGRYRVRLASLSSVEHAGVLGRAISNKGLFRAL